MKYHIKTKTIQSDFGNDSLFDKICDDFLLETDFDNLHGVQTMQTFCDGELEIKDGKVSLFYDDSDENDTKTCLSFDENNPKDITLTRSGFLSTVMLFSEGKRHICVYSTQIMPFEICIYSKRVDNRLLTDGVLEIVYMIEIKGSQAQKTIFRMEITK